MSMDTTREDMTLAVLEGVAFALRDSFEVAKSLGIEIKSTKICGGGAKSPLWKKMIANILNVTIEDIIDGKVEVIIYGKYTDGWEELDF